MGTSDSHEHQGRPRVSAKQMTLTTDDPAWGRNVAEYADACIKSMSRPKRGQWLIRPEPIVEEVTERAAEVGSRLAAAADRHPPYGLDATNAQRELRSILNEVFGDGIGSDRIDALIRQCAAKAVSRWLRHEGIEEAGIQESVDYDEILVDPIGAVAPELVEDTDPVELLLDEFHAELLVELVQMIAGEGMFPGLALVKLLWALYRWAIDRIIQTKPGDRALHLDRRRGLPITRECEQTVIDELLDPDMRTKVEAKPEETRDD